LGLLVKALPLPVKAPEEPMGNLRNPELPGFGPDEEGKFGKVMPCLAKQLL
jgi:hypothetical protein